MLGNLRYLLAAAIAGITFGSIGFWVLRLTTLGSVEVAMFRYMFGILFLGAFIILFRDKVLIRDKKILVLAGLSNISLILLYIASINLGAKLGDAAFLLDTGYMFSVIFSWLFLHERIGRRDGIAILIATIGAAFILKPLTLIQNYAELFALGSGIVSGFQLVIFRKSGRVHSSMTTTFVSFVISIILLLPLVAINFTIPSATDLLYLAGFGLIGAALPLFLLITSLSHLKTFETGVPALLEPLSAAIIGFLAFGQVLDQFSMIGGGLILVSIAYAAMKWKG